MLLQNVYPALDTNVSVTDYIIIKDATLVEFDNSYFKMGTKVLIVHTCTGFRLNCGLNVYSCKRTLAWR